MLQHNEWTFHETTEQEKYLPAYRYSVINETATCPTAGALTYINGISNPQEDEDKVDIRNMALRAGDACHHVFAAVRLWGIRDNKEIFEREGIRLFGDERFNVMKSASEKFISEDELLQRRAFCLQALYSSGFTDDPSDKNRTMSNLETVCCAYIDRWNYERKVAILPDRVGIEMKFDLVITNTLTGWRARFIGTLDALHERIDGATGFIVHENKTASRITDAWATVFKMSHQVTGYNIAASTITKTPVMETLVFGTQIPLNMREPVRIEPALRENHHIDQWLKWFQWGVNAFESARQNPADAPKFTHSCGRFFSECKFMPYCAGDADEKKLIINNLKGENII